MDDTKTYAVTLRSKYTAMVVTFGNVRAKNPTDARFIANAAMAHPEAWEASGSFEQRPVRTLNIVNLQRNDP